MRFESASELIDWIHGARLNGEKNGLANMQALCGALGNPQKRLTCVHVAGTNGKGSVCAMLESVLRISGLKTGLYTSPFLTRYQERIRIGGALIGDDLFLEAGNRLWEAASRLPVHATAFELGTALAFCAFEMAGVQAAVIEVGLGGRLDPTNVIDPMLSVIAPVALDHMEYLGSTIEDIAREKAGIIKPGRPAVLSPRPAQALSVWQRIAGERQSPVLVGDENVSDCRVTAYGSQFDLDSARFGHLKLHLPLPGRHQIENAALAVRALEALDMPLTGEQVAQGLFRTRWPGRLEWIDESILLDGAHNPHGVQALASFLKETLSGRRIVLLTAMMRDKQPAETARILAPCVGEAVATQLNQARSMDAESLAEAYRAQGCKTLPVGSVEEALREARRRAGRDVLLVAGSLYLVGAVRGILGAEE